jgi:hypothetical protein
VDGAAGGDVSSPLAPLAASRHSAWSTTSVFDRARSATGDRFPPGSCVTDSNSHLRLQLLTLQFSHERLNHALRFLTQGTVTLPLSSFQFRKEKESIFASVRIKNSTLPAKTVIFIQFAFLRFWHNICQRFSPNSLKEECYDPEPIHSPGARCNPDLLSRHGRSHSPVREKYS